MEAKKITALFIVIGFLALIQESISSPYFAKKPSLREDFIKKYGDAPWQVPKGQEEYYSVKSPDDDYRLQTLLFQDHSDPAYGRDKLDFSPSEKAVRKKMLAWDARVYLDEEENVVSKKPTKKWVWYQVWWNPNAAVNNKKKVDLLFAHGLGGYGGRFAQFAEKFLDAGYRVIVPDLPSHGRSTGPHAYLPDLKVLAQAVHIVLNDVAEKDLEYFGEQREVIISGASIGGFTTMLYGLMYHSPGINAMDLGIKDFKPKVKGLLALCPMLGIAPGSQPNYAGELLLKVLSKSFPNLRLPKLSNAQGKYSKDVQAEQELLADPQSFHGLFRAATGIGIKNGLEFIEKHKSELSLPYKILHGEKDQMTSYAKSIEFFEKATIPGMREIKLYPNMEHGLLRRGRDAEDDKDFQQVTDDMLEWLDRLSKSDYSKKHVLVSNNKLSDVEKKLEHIYK